MIKETRLEPHQKQTRKKTYHTEQHGTGPKVGDFVTRAKQTRAEQKKNDGAQEGKRRIQKRRLHDGSKNDGSENDGSENDGEKMTGQQRCVRHFFASFFRCVVSQATILARA